MTEAHEDDNGGREQMAGVLQDMSASDVLTFVEGQHAARLAAERSILTAAYQWAVLHHPDRLPPDDRRGRARARPAGGPGTPLITEYAAAAFGARIQTSPYGARRLIADAVDLHLRLPRLWAGIHAGTVRVTHARHVADATRDLSKGEAAWVDAEVVESADGRLAWRRFEALVEGKVAAAAPEAARAREEAAARETGVRVSRINKFGMATLTVRANALIVAGIDAAVAAVAERLKDKLPDLNVQERRVAALALLANPENGHIDSLTDQDTPAGRKAGPVKVRVKAYLHFYADSAIARLEGRKGPHGPVTLGRLRGMFEEADCKVTLTPVMDLGGQAPVDAYEAPARLREAVHLIHPADTFPFAPNRSRKVDLDHAVPFAEGGPTSTDNLGPLTRTHHRIKTHAGWTVRHPFPGIVIWRDPYGAFYLIDPTGTRRIHSTEAA